MPHRESQGGRKYSSKHRIEKQPTDKRTGSSQSFVNHSKGVNNRRSAPEIPPATSQSRHQQNPGAPVQHQHTASSSAIADPTKSWASLLSSKPVQNAEYAESGQQPVPAAITVPSQIHIATQTHTSPPSSLPSSPKSFTFERGNGVVLVHESSPSNPIDKSSDIEAKTGDELNHALTTPKEIIEEKGADTPRDSAPPDPAPIKNLSWAEKAKLAAARPMSGQQHRVPQIPPASPLKTNSPLRGADHGNGTMPRSSNPETGHNDNIVDGDSKTGQSSTRIKVEHQTTKQTNQRKPPEKISMSIEEAVCSLCSALETWKFSNNNSDHVCNDRVQPRGFKNPGNLCFVNAVLQALMGSTSVCRLILALQTAASIFDSQTYPVLSAMAAISLEFKKIEGDGSFPTLAASASSSNNINKSNNHNNNIVALLGGFPVSSALIVELIHRFSPRQQDKAEGQVEQEDAHEFLHFLLDEMHMELVALKRNRDGDRNKRSVGEEERNAASHDIVDGDDDDDGWLVQSGKRAVRQQEVSATGFKEDSSVITVIFQGKLATSVACSGVPNSVTVHPFMIVEVPIYSDSITTIESALDALTAAETLEDYKPSGSAISQPAARTERFLHLPQVLILHLMRFQFTGKSAKINKFIEFRPKLIMKPSWMATGTSDRGAVYSLVSTVTHHGKNITSGHYTADAIQSGGNWLRFDDSDVYVVKEDKVFSERPYLLVYERLQRNGKLLN